MTTKYKCYHCHISIPESDLVDGKCPKCLSDADLEKMCPQDHVNCSHEIVNGLAYCPECGSPMCPECRCHDVSQISRVTGYLQDVDGWNAGKQQELRDRKRYNPVGESS